MNMKTMMSRFVFKPRDLHANCDSEGFAHKAKIVCFSLAMASIATTYQHYFNNLVYRSGQYQQQALAGDIEFVDFFDGTDPRNLWAQKNTLDILNAKSFKELKYMSTNSWKDTEYLESNYDSDRNSNNVEIGWVEEKRWSDANGDPKDNNYYWTQTQRLDAEKWALQDYNEVLDANVLTWSQKQYDNWYTMHDGVMWFDTAGCLSGSHIGDVNKVEIRGKTIRQKRWDISPWDTTTTCTVNAVDGQNNCIYTDDNAQNPNWSKKVKDSNGQQTAQETVPVAGDQISLESTWWTSMSTPYGYTYDVNEERVQYAYSANSQRDQITADQYGYDISVHGTPNWTNEDLYRDYLTDYIDLFEDCDVDCQATGSQLTLAAGLMGLSYGIVALNALFMFCGAWRYRWRVCSVYCTLFACMFQFIIAIVVGALLFTKYNAVCGRSMVKTWGDEMNWTMADDFYTTFSMWIVTFVLMFVFCCFGLCSAFRPMKD